MKASLQSTREQAAWCNRFNGVPGARMHRGRVQRGPACLTSSAMADGGATTHGDVATERNRAWVERENDNELTAELGEGTTRLELVGEARIERRRPADAVGEGGGWRRLEGAPARPGACSWCRRGGGAPGQLGTARGSQWPRRRRCASDEPTRANETEREAARGRRWRLGFDSGREEVLGGGFILSGGIAGWSPCGHPRPWTGRARPRRSW